MSFPGMILVFTTTDAEEDRCADALKGALIGRVKQLRFKAPASGGLQLWVALRDGQDEASLRREIAMFRMGWTSRARLF